MPDRRHKILVVDDNFEIVELVNSRLSLAGYQVVCAVNGEAALRRAREEKPHLIIMDILLPDKNGPEVVQILEEEGLLARTKVLFLSAVIGKTGAYADGRLTVGDREYECLPKPFKGPDLLSRVGALLARA